MLDLPEIHRDSRISDLRQVMSIQSIDNFLSIDPVTLRWLSGFTGSTGKLLLTAAETHLLTDGRYADQATQEICGTGIELFVGNGTRI